MKSETKKVRIKLISKMLGTVPKNKEIYASYVATKKKDITNGEIEKELETVEEIEEKGWTGFHQNEKGLFIYSYMIKGHLKAACEVLQATGDIKKIPAYKKWFDLLLFVTPKEISLGKDKPDEVLERPLRAMTPQGPRVTLSRSDAIAENTELEFEIELLENSKGLTMEMIEKCLDYGKYVGLGQWRGSGGYGQYEVVKTG